MTTAKATKAEAPTTTMWDGAETEVLDGLDLIDKAALVGKPFKMTAFKLSVGARDVAYAWVEGVDADGNQFVFNDSSSGVRAEVMDYLSKKGRGDVLDEWFDVAIVAPRGLRYSEYDVKDERGRDKRAKTFYLTKSGRRV